MGFVSEDAIKLIRKKITWKITRDTKSPNHKKNIIRTMFFIFVVRKILQNICIAFFLKKMLCAAYPQQ